MVVIDNCNIFNPVLDMIAGDQETGYCAIGTCQRVGQEYALSSAIFVDQVTYNKSSVQIDISQRMLSALLSLCKEELLPFIIYTQPRSQNPGQNLEFCPQELEFFRQFAASAKLRGIPSCLFIATDGYALKYCLWNTQTDSYRVQNTLTSSMLIGSYFTRFF